MQKHHRRTYLPHPQMHFCGRKTTAQAISKLKRDSAKLKEDCELASGDVLAQIKLSISNNGVFVNSLIRSYVLSFAIPHVCEHGKCSQKGCLNNCWEIPSVVFVEACGMTEKKCNNEPHAPD